MQITAEKEMANYAFIDSQNLNLSVENQGWKLDFRKFRIYLKDKYDVSKAYLFIGFVPGNDRLYIGLQDSGYLLVFKPTLMTPKGKIKGNVDAELVLHTMIELPNYDRAVIISGDGDFHCLVEYLVGKDKLLKLLIPDKNKYSSLLRKYQKYISFISDLRKKLQVSG
jgi:uncharacterized LabA/DUF88 family protein